MPKAPKRFQANPSFIARVGALSRMSRVSSGNIKWDVTSSIGDLTLGRETGSVVGISVDRRSKGSLQAAQLASVLAPQEPVASLATDEKLARQLLKSEGNPGMHPQNEFEEEGTHEVPRVNNILARAGTFDDPPEEDDSAMLTRNTEEYRRPVLRAMMSAIKNLVLLPKYSQAYVILLSGNSLTDLSPLVACPRLRLLDVSFNKLQKLPDSTSWSSFKELEFLYLNDNDLKWPSVLGLSGATSIIALTLFNNPLAHNQYYRQFAANILESGRLIDNHIITDEELIENACFPEDYASCGPRTYFAIDLLHTQEYKAKNEDFRELLDVHKKIINRLFETTSPATRIQKVVRGRLLQEYYKSLRHKEALNMLAKKEGAAAKIQGAARMYLIYIYAERDLKKLLQSERSKREMMAPFMPRHMMEAVDHAMVLQRFSRIFIAKLRRRKRAANRIILCLRSWANLCIALERITFDSGSKLNQGFFVTDDALGVVYDALVAACSKKEKVVPSSTNADRWRKTDVHLQHFRVTPVYMVRQKHAIMQYWDTKETLKTIMRLEQRREIDPRAQRARALYHFADCNMFQYKFRQSLKRDINLWSSVVRTLPLRSRGHYLDRNLRQVTRSCLQVDAKRQKRRIKMNAIRLTWVKIRNHREMRFVVRGLRQKTDPASSSKQTRRRVMPIMSGYHVRASMAIIILQNAWRAYVVRRSINIRETLVDNRASTLLQRWWRTHLGLKRRLKFIHLLNSYVRKINSSTLFIEAEVYYILVQLRPNFIEHYEQQLSKDEFRFGFEADGSIHPYGKAIGMSSNSPFRFPQWIWAARECTKVPPQENVKYDPTAVLSTPRMSPVPTPRRMTVSITSNSVDSSEVIISTLHNGSIVDAISSPVEDPDGICEPVDIGMSRLFFDKSTVKDEQVTGHDTLPRLPRITLWNSDDEVRLGSKRRLIRIQYSDIVEARRRAAVLMRSTYNPRDECFVRLFSHAMLGNADALFSSQRNEMTSLQSAWLLQYGPQCLHRRDRVKIEILCQMFTQEVLPFDVPKPPSPEQIPVCLPESLSARLPRPHRPPSNVVKRPLSARDLSRHSKVTDRELDERRRSSAPSVEPIIKRPPAKTSADDDNPYNHEAVTDDRDLEDLGKLLRLKVKKQVDEGMLANKKNQATYTAPSGGGATARPTLLQKYEVPQFVKQCRRAEEAHIRNKEVEEEARREYVSQLNEKRKLRHQNIAESREQYRQKAVKNMNQERAFNSEQLYEYDRYRAMKLLEVKQQAQKSKQKKTKAYEIRKQTTNFTAASSMLSRYGSKSGGKRTNEKETAQRRQQHDMVIRKGQDAKATAKYKKDKEIAKRQTEITRHRAIMKHVEEERRQRWVPPPPSEVETKIRELLKVRKGDKPVKDGKALSIVSPSPETTPKSKPGTTTPTSTKSRARTASPIRTEKQVKEDKIVSPGASPWAVPESNEDKIIELGILQGSQILEDAVSTAPSFGSYTVDEPYTLHVTRQPQKSAQCTSFS